MALLELPDRLLSFFFLRFGGAAVDLDSKIPKGGLTMIGKMIRLERIINRDSHRTVIIPMDHGVTVGPVEGLADMRMTVSKVVAPSSCTRVWSGQVTAAPAGMWA